MARKSKSNLSELYLEENKDQIYENALAEIQSFHLPLGTTLRYASLDNIILFMLDLFHSIAVL